jgi:dipeptidyl aminopeptidase/acylaminoacyl peptidase
LRAQSCVAAVTGYTCDINSSWGAFFMKLFNTAKLLTSSAIISVLGMSAPVMAEAADPVAGAAEKAPNVVSAASQRFGTDVFVKKPNMLTPRLSTNADKLAYMMNDAGKPVLAVLDLAKPGSKPKIVMAGEEAREAGDRTVGSYRWVGNNYLVVNIAMREDLGGGPADFQRLVSYDYATGKLTQLAWDGAGGSAVGILDVDHDKGTILLQRNTVNAANERKGLPQVVNVDLKTGKFKIVQNTNPEVRSWFADSDGIVRAGFGGDGDTGKQRVMYRSDSKGTFATVMNAVDKSFTGGLPEPELIVPGSDIAYASSRKDGYNRIYKLDMKTMQVGEMVFETKGFDVESIIPNKDANGIAGYSTFNGTYKDVWVEPLYKDIVGYSEELFGKGQVDLVNIARNEQKAILRVGGTKKHGGFYLYDLPSGKINLLNWQRTDLADSGMNPVKAEWYTARDGMKLQAVVTYPRHRAGKNLPVVIMPHGGPFGAISATNRNEPWSQPLAEAGYLVIQPNYRGSGGYGKEFEETGRKPDGYGVKMQDDLNDLLTFYGQKGIIDPKRACIMGWSYGGYAAARGAQRDGSIWKCAIAGAGVYDFPMMTAWDKKNLGKFSSGFQATSNDPKGISSAQNTDGKWAPILIVAGVRDARIPIEQSRTLVSRLKSSGKIEGTDFRYVEQKQGTHQLPYDDVHIQWIQEAEAWLNRWNPAYVATDTDKPLPVAGANAKVAAK